MHYGAVHALAPQETQCVPKKPSNAKSGTSCGLQINSEH